MKTYRIKGNANHTLVHADMRDVDPPNSGLLILDPDWDQWSSVPKGRLPRVRSTLAFTSPGFIGNTVKTLGPPRHLMAWDCRAAEQVSDRYPMRRLKLCLWYGHAQFFSLERSRYVLGEKSRRGKRLQELFHEDGYSISQVVERRGHPYAKPIPWVRSLISAVSMRGLVYDPYAGSGTTLFASDSLSRPSFLVELDEGYVDSIISRCKLEGMGVEILR